MNETVQDFASFDDFYEFYLTEHSNRTNRRLHFIGSSAALLVAGVGLVTLQPWLILPALVIGYAFAWVGHFFFEHNKPATFKYPWASFKGDWRMWRDIATGRIPF